MNTNKKTVIIDIEADDLNATRIHCIVCRVVGESDHLVFTSADSFKDFLPFARTVDCWIGHNILGFDAPTVNRLLSPCVDLSKCTDTLVLSKLANRKPADGLTHSLKSWGKRLRMPKTEFNDWSKLTPEMIEYCKQDVNITLAIYQKLWPQMSKYQYAVDLEHWMYLACFDMEQEGFPFKYKEAKELYDSLVSRRTVLDSEIHQSFPGKYTDAGYVVPRATVRGPLHRGDFRWYKGDDYTIFEAGAAFTRIKWEPFNPASPRQVVDRLWDAGWRPTEKTGGHAANDDEQRREHYSRYGWKINEKNLATLPEHAPKGARSLLERLIINTRITTLETWFEAYDHKTGRIHGRFDSVGTWTHRMSHTQPNMANIAAKKSIKYNTPELRRLAVDLGGTMRGLWGVEASSGYSLVGTDAEGIQLRVFAHLLNDPVLIEALVTGRKDQGTDPHTFNLKRINEKFGAGTCKDRDNAKTFIYAFFLGAGDGKVAEIFNVPVSVAKAIKEYMYTIYPGLKTLRDRIRTDAERGYFINLDGRPVKCDSEHKMLAGYLQAGEASIMKVAVRRATEKLQEARLPFKLVNMVHDEMLFLGPSNEAPEAKKITEEAIAWAGQELKLNCPMKGEGKYGLNWLEVH